MHKLTTKYFQNLICMPQFKSLKGKTNWVLKLIVSLRNFVGKRKQKEEMKFVWMSRDREEGRSTWSKFASFLRHFENPLIQRKLNGSEFALHGWNRISF